MKWQGKIVGKLKLDCVSSLAQLQTEILTATGVEPENQKVFFKGKLLKGNDSIAGLGIGPGDFFLLMGTPKNKIPPSCKSEVGEETRGSEAAESSHMPRGLINLGNTCYLNSCLQLFKLIPAIAKPADRVESIDQPLLSAIRKFGRLPAAKEPFIPLELVSMVRNIAPHFSEGVLVGKPQQQDAEECWSLMLAKINEGDPQVRESMTGLLTVSLKSDASGEASETNETFTKLACPITQNTSDLYSAIRASLITEIERRSQANGPVELIHKRSSICQAPSYLCIQLLRFFWKQQEQVSAKILKKIPFTLNLDLKEFLTADCKDDNAYELCGLITHTGRSSDSGHYVSWVKDNEGKHWWKCDDEKITAVSDEDILKLDGGGDWHMAYLLLYRKKKQ